MAIENLIYDKAVHLNSKMMEIAMERQKVIANNLANANTPGYTRRDVDFKETLANIIDRNDRAALDQFQGDMIKDSGPPARLDGNNVSQANEMNEMMQNSVLHNLLSKAYSTKMGILKQAISK